MFFIENFAKRKIHDEINFHEKKSSLKTYIEKLYFLQKIS